ncbi:ejaculatory bulb-specific protein 3-like [Ceratina calcarata]|uniref:Ejaculatory bulb-specific protein 3-like n=1 Tax=Ceratina calcarata TaxID=156304 RepID=A0AAJ7WC50_9HYME|nr:ejaculatory bulb-specific protein 3-like [Ceratina calcarata]
MRYSCIALITLSLLAWVYGEELYSDKYDYIDADDILSNDRLREQYYKCFMDTGPCVTPDSKFMREHILEAIATKCKKCTEKQKTSLNKVADYYAANDPEKWEALIQKVVMDFKDMAGSSDA